MPTVNGKYECDSSIPRVAVDFDGVLYPGGCYVDEFSFGERPIRGAIEWLNAISTVFEVVILTARMCSEPHTDHDNLRRKVDIAQDIYAWLQVHGALGVGERIIVYPTEYGKPSVTAFIDDHALRYAGGEHPDLFQLMEKKPWWKS